MSVRPRPRPSLEQRRDGRTNSFPFLPLAAWPRALHLEISRPIYHCHPFLALFCRSLSRASVRPTEDGAGVQVGRPLLFTQVKHLWRLTLPLVKQTVLAVPARYGSFQYGTDSRLTRNAPRVCGNGCRGQEFNQICSCCKPFFATFRRGPELKHRKQRRVLRPCCTS